MARVSGRVPSPRICQPDPSQRVCQPDPMPRVSWRVSGLGMASAAAESRGGRVGSLGVAVVEPSSVGSGKKVPITLCDNINKFALAQMDIIASLVSAFILPIISR